MTDIHGRPIRAGATITFTSYLDDTTREQTTVTESHGQLMATITLKAKRRLATLQVPLEGLLSRRIEVVSDP